MASQMTPRTTLLHHTTVGTLAPGIRPWLQMETPRTTLLHRMTKGALAAGICPWLQRERRILSKPTLAPKTLLLTPAPTLITCNLG